MRECSARVEEEAAAFRRENARGFAPDREDAPYGGKERVSVRPKQQIIAPTVPRNLKRVAPSANTASTSPSAGGSANRVQQGQLIEHERFGLGEVLKVEGEGEQCEKPPSASRMRETNNFCCASRVLKCCHRIVASFVSHRNGIFVRG